MMRELELESDNSSDLGTRSGKKYSGRADKWRQDGASAGPDVIY